MRAITFSHYRCLRARNKMPAMSSWWSYVVRTAGTDEQKSIAAKSGLGPTVINRWASGSVEPSAKSVVQFARAYGRPAVEALVASNYLAAGDASKVIEIHHSAEKISDAELVAEVERRLKEAQHVMATSQIPGTPRETDQDEEGDLGRAGGAKTDSAAARTRRAFRRQSADKRDDG